MRVVPIAWDLLQTTGTLVTAVASSKGKLCHFFATTAPDIIPSVVVHCCYGYTNRMHYN